jgi:hypothetical protein
MRAAILFFLATVVGRTTAFAPNEKGNAPLDIREEPSSLSKRKQKTGIAYRANDDPMVRSSPDGINPKYFANGQVVEQSQEHPSSSSPVSVTEEHKMTHDDNTILDKSAIHNYVKIPLHDTKAVGEWQVLPPSAKSIRTLNPIRAIVDPIVANIKTGEERGDGKNHISLGVSALHGWHVHCYSIKGGHFLIHRDFVSYT